MTTPLLSVVIQNYNYAHYLPQAIDSIVAQDFPIKDMELIIIDDASTDNSKQVIQEYAEKHSFIKVIQYPENKGTHYSANHSMDLARGEYIHWLAADDWRDKRFLRKSIDALLKHPKIGICCSDFGYAKEQTGRSHLLSNSLIPGVTSPIAFYPDQLIPILRTTEFWIPGHTAILKKSSAIKYEKFKKNLKEKCDWFLFHQIALQEGVVYIPETLAYWYIHTSSYSAQNSRSKEQKKAVAREILSTLDQFNESRKLFHKATILRWAFSEVPLEFFKPKRIGAFFELVKKKLLRISRKSLKALKSAVIRSK